MKLHLQELNSGKLQCVLLVYPPFPSPVIQQIWNARFCTLINLGHSITSMTVPAFQKLSTHIFWNCPILPCPVLEKVGP